VQGHFLSPLRDQNRERVQDQEDADEQRDSGEHQQEGVEETKGLLEALRFFGSGLVAGLRLDPFGKYLLDPVAKLSDVGVMTRGDRHAGVGVLPAKDESLRG